METIHGRSVQEWAEAISLRLLDDNGIGPDNPAYHLMYYLLSVGLVDRPGMVKALIGTEIIEEDYFELLD